MKKIIIYGTSNFTKISYYELSKKFDIVAFTTDEEYINDYKFLSKPLVDFKDVENTYPPQYYDMLVLRSHRNMRERKIAFYMAKEKGYKFENYVADDVFIGENVKIGENNLIFSGSYLGPFGVLGDNNIIRPLSYIGHNFNIGNHVYVSPGCKIAGYCLIEDLSFIGIGSVVVDNLHILEETIIGAGSLVLKNTEKQSKYYGNPCVKVSEHKNGIII